MSDKALEERVAAIEARNAKVSCDKAWETSATRRILIATITYCVAGFLLVLLGSAEPYFYAFIPVAGYLISTFTLPFIRHIWEKSAYDRTT